MSDSPPRPEPEADPSFAHSERRRSTRKKVLGVSGDIDSVPVQILEIGAHGCLVAARGLLRSGDVQSLHVACDGDDCVLYVRIVHVMRAQGGPDPEVAFVAGLEFLTPGAQHEGIQRVISFCTGSA